MSFYICIILNISNSSLNKVKKVIRLSRKRGPRVALPQQIMRYVVLEIVVKVIQGSLKLCRRELNNFT